ncbi:MAG: homoaconitate hydratase [Thermoplasmata archaeon]|nr:homoaconitate hydratase [Thermoplasmata archaeon]
MNAKDRTTIGSNNGSCGNDGMHAGTNSVGSGSPRLGEVRIVDTTCRDGEQMPGVAFTGDDKLMIAGGLQQIGVEQIETFATYNDSDRKCAKQLRAQMGSISIMGWNRLVKTDISDSIGHDVDAVSISTDTSDISLSTKLKITREQQLSRLVDCIEFAKGHGVYVCFNAGDATRTDLSYLIEFAETGLDAGADRFRICDTIGILTPSTSARLVHSLMSRVDIDLEFHAHNDFGLAVANALSACEAASAFDGRRIWISTTINGLGERAGNVPLEVLVMNLRTHYGLAKYNAEHIVPLCRSVEHASGLRIPLNYPIVGGNMFTHKSGIHVDGILKDPHLYEAFDPSILGVSRQIVIGKHSGSASIKHKLKLLELDASADAVERIRIEVNRVGELKKDNLSDSELIAIYRSIVEDGAFRDSTHADIEKRISAVDANIEWKH